MIRDLDNFLKEFDNKSKFEKSGLEWNDMLAIADHYASKKEGFDKIAREYFAQVMEFKPVHSVRYRLKDPDHLIEKIIRKTADDAKVISVDNYLEEITDIIGIRALHVYKNDFLLLHQQICKKYKKHFCESVHIKLRQGDDKSIFNPILKDDPKFEENNTYRSIHYVINHLDEVRVEIQTRTVFEEGWSEVDHKSLYKKNNENELVRFASSILSRLSGTCDELAELIKMIDVKSGSNKKMAVGDMKLEAESDIIDVLEAFIKKY